MRKFLFLFLQNKLSPDVSLSLKPNSLHLQGFLDPNRTSGSVLEITFADGCSYVGIYVCVRVRACACMCVNLKGAELSPKCTIFRVPLVAQW